VQLHERHANDDLVCMSVSVDKPRRSAEKVYDFLKSHEAEFPNYYLEEQGAIGSSWGVSTIPHVRIYDRNGKLKGVYDNYSKVNSIVDDLLKANGK
jgi:hypothetical protein